jgi:hypothetical protein
VPERLDRVAISTRSGTVELPWSSRDLLLHEIRNLDGAERIRTAFDAVGASRPVPLSSADKALLLEAIEACVTVDELPEGVWRLRTALSGE